MNTQQVWLETFSGSALGFWFISLSLTFIICFGIVLIFKPKYDNFSYAKAFRVTFLNFVIYFGLGIIAFVTLQEPLVDILCDSTCGSGFGDMVYSILFLFFITLLAFISTITLSIFRIKKIK